MSMVVQSVRNDYNDVSHLFDFRIAITQVLFTEKKHFLEIKSKCLLSKMNTLN